MRQIHRGKTTNFFCRRFNTVVPKIPLDPDSKCFHVHLQLTQQRETWPSTAEGFFSYGICCDNVESLTRPSASLWCLRSAVTTGTAMVWGTRGSGMLGHQPCFRITHQTSMQSFAYFQSKNRQTKPTNYREGNVEVIAILELFFPSFANRSHLPSESICNNSILGTRRFGNGSIFIF